MGLFHVIVGAVIAIAAYLYFSKRQGCELLKSLGIGCPVASQKADQANKPAEKPAAAAFNDAPTQRSGLTGATEAVSSNAGVSDKNSAYLNAKLEAQANASQPAAATPNPNLPAKQNNNSAYAQVPATEPTSHTRTKLKKSKKSKPSCRSTSKKNKIN